MSNQGKPIVGVEWLGQCWDIVEMDPLALIQSYNSRVRVFNVQAEGPSGDTVGGYQVPVGIRLHNVPSLQIRTTSQVIYDSHDFRAKMSAEFGVNVSFQGLFEFAASASNAEAAEKTASRKQVMKFSMMTREYQHVSMRRTTDPTRESELDAATLRPLMSQAFKLAVAKLPGEASAVYRTFIETFGTHFAVALTLGGVAYEELLIDESELSEGKLSESALDVMAKAGLEGFEAGATAKQATERAQKKDAQYKIERSAIKFIGGKGGTELQTSWVAEVDVEPAPIFPRSEFARLTAALTAGFFPDDPAIEVKRQLLDDALDAYIIEKGSQAGKFVRFGDKMELLGTRGGGVCHWTSTLAHSTKTPLPALATITIEPIADDGHDGTIVYTGRARPVRIRAADAAHGELGYLERSPDAQLFSDGSTWFGTALTKNPDPERSRWFIESVPAKPGPRPLVLGEPVSVRCEVSGRVHCVGTMIGPNYWLVQGVGPTPYLVSFKAGQAS